MVFSGLDTGAGALIQMHMAGGTLAALSEQVLAKVQPQEPSFLWSLFFICFNPIFWNIMARLEHKTQIVTKMAGRSRLLGCYVLAFAIFMLGVYRDYLYEVCCAPE